MKKHRRKQRKTFAEELMAFAHKLNTIPSAVTPAQLTALSAKLSLSAANFADFTAKAIAKAGLKPAPMSKSMSQAEVLLTPLKAAKTPAATPAMPISFSNSAVADGQERSTVTAGAVDESKRRAAEEEPFESRPAPAATGGYPPDSD